MAKLDAIEIPLVFKQPEQTEVLRKLADLGERLERMGWRAVCMNEALAALMDKKLADEEARKKALGWLEHAFSK